MFITQSYKFELDNIVYVGANVPEGAEILETLNILNAEEGFELVRKSDSKNVGANIWLREGDSQDNYEEVERQEPVD